MSTLDTPVAGRGRTRSRTPVHPANRRGTAAPRPTRGPGPTRPPAPKPAGGTGTRWQGRATTVRSPAVRSPAARSAARPARAPFVLLVIALLGGGLVSLLLLNTVLQQGSFQLDSLRGQHTALTHRMQALQQDVTYESSPETIAQKARTLGMEPSGDAAKFVDPHSGKVFSSSGVTGGAGAGHTAAGSAASDGHTDSGGANR